MELGVYWKPLRPLCYNKQFARENEKEDAIEPLTKENKYKMIAYAIAL